MAAAIKSGRESVSKAAPYLRHGVTSGAVPAIIGGIGLLSGLRALRRGQRTRGLGRLVGGAAFVAIAVAQRRSRGRGEGAAVTERDVVDTGPDIGSIADEAGGVGEDDHADGRATAEVADTSPDVPSPEADAATGAGTHPEEIDRLGAAALDRESREVPVPQRAFNQGFLSHSAEAFWGIRTRDDAVVVSQDYDAIDGPAGVQFVASSEIGQDVRELPIPNAILTHWDEVAGGGTAVAGGDDVLFVTTDSLAADGLLRVLPAKWDDDLSE